MPDPEDFTGNFNRDICGKDKRDKKGCPAILALHPVPIFRDGTEANGLPPKGSRFAARSTNPGRYAGNAEMKDAASAGHQPSVLSDATQGQSLSRKGQSLPRSLHQPDITASEGGCPCGAPSQQSAPN